MCNIASQDHHADGHAMAAVLALAGLILLLQGQLLAAYGPARLATQTPVPLAAHVLRLLPGDDLVGSLRAFAAERGLRAACVLSCVGSTSLTTLRPAGCAEARVFDGKREIVSLVGTFSADGHHLHMSVADAACVVVGGHALEGCTVRTTAEIVVGELQGLRFARELDDRTGFRELFLAERADARAAP
jgi:hypothetical protein